MIVILDVQVDFVNDLRSDDFKIKQSAPGEFVVCMPACRSQVHLNDIKFRHEQSEKVLSWLLPGALATALGRNFGTDERNQIIADAKSQAGQLALQKAEDLKVDIQKSAEKTISSIARGFGAIKVSFEFNFPDARSNTVDVPKQLAA